MCILCDMKSLATIDREKCLIVHIFYLEFDVFYLFIWDLVNNYRPRLISQLFAFHASTEVKRFNKFEGGGY